MINGTKSQVTFSPLSSAQLLSFQFLDDGHVFVWGYGILGLGPAVQRAKAPTIIPPTLFGLNAYERQSRVEEKIYCISENNNNNNNVQSNLIHSFYRYLKYIAVLVNSRQ